MSIIVSVRDALPERCRWLRSSLLGLVVLAACGSPRPGSGGDASVPIDAGVDSDRSDASPADASVDAPPDSNSPPENADCQLTAITPSIATAGDSITLEGTFRGGVIVHFPGATPVFTTLLAPHRATAIVPASATEGDLTIVCESRLGPLPFRRAPFAIGLGGFEAHFDQAHGGQQDARLATPRSGHTSVAVRRHLYIIGGTDGSGSLNSVEHARVNPDGSLGAFGPAPGATLTTARQLHSTLLVGSSLYVIGGRGDAALGSVERAIIDVDGSLGPFTPVADVALTTARQGHASVVIGNHLYVLGGFGTTSLNSVERAIIKPDGSLGPFALVDGVTLTTARREHTAVVLGNYLYVLGGSQGNTFLRDVERAPIDGDGALGAFVSVPDALLVTPRSGHTAEVLGKTIFVFGGVNDSGSLNTIERIALGGDVVLDHFTVVPDVTLTTARHGHTTALIGNYLYALGGAGGTTLHSVERTTFNASGSLGPFAIVGGVTVGKPFGRAGFVTVVLGNYLHIMGGFMGAVERADVHADGTVGPFIIQSNQMTSNRIGARAAVVGNFLYVLGGQASDGDPAELDTIERSTIAADGSLGPFTTISVHLVTGRHDHTVAVLGSNLYVLGGSSGSALNSVERATIDADGSLGSFAIVPDNALKTARSDHTISVIRDFVYVVGGSGASILSTVERAAIDSDGSLGAFAIVPGSGLAVGRAGHTSAVVGSFLYVFGGATRSETGATIYLESIERSVIAADGSMTSLGPVFGVNMGARAEHSTAIIGNFLYVLAGNSFGPLTSVSRAPFDAGN